MQLDREGELRQPKEDLDAVSPLFGFGKDDCTTASKRPRAERQEHSFLCLDLGALENALIEQRRRREEGAKGS